MSIFVSGLFCIIGCTLASNDAGAAAKHVGTHINCRITPATAYIYGLKTGAVIEQFARVCHFLRIKTGKIKARQTGTASKHV